MAIGAVGGQVMPHSVAAVIWYLGMINGVLIVFNMIPAFPLDGGRVLRSVAPSLSVETLVEDYIYRMHHKMFPVTDNGRLPGCVTTRDVQKVPRDQGATTTVARISRACKSDSTIAPTSDTMQALA